MERPTGCESRLGWGASLLGQASEQGQVACVNWKGALPDRGTAWGRRSRTPEEAKARAPPTLDGKVRGHKAREIQAVVRILSPKK